MIQNRERLLQISVEQMMDLMIDFIIKYQEVESSNKLHQLYDLNSEKLKTQAHKAFEQIFEEYQIIQLTKDTRKGGAYFPSSNR